MQKKCININYSGTGTRDMIRLCKEAGLPEPEFVQESSFKLVSWRNGDEVSF